MSARLGKQKNVLELAQRLSSRSRFTTEECRSLLNMYYQLTASVKMDRLHLREILHPTFGITDDVMLDRVYRVFDRDNDGVINETEWVEGISVMCRGSPESQIEFSYDIYDINGDRSLAREELAQCLRGCMYPYGGVLQVEEVDEALREIVEIGMKKLDKDRDGQITHPDFINACLDDPLLLQSIGPCLPTTKAMAAFLATFTENYRAYTTEWNDEWKMKMKHHKEVGDSDNLSDSNSHHSIVTLGPGMSRARSKSVSGKKSSSFTEKRSLTGKTSLQGKKKTAKSTTKLGDFSMEGSFLPKKSTIMKIR